MQFGVEIGNSTILYYFFVLVILIAFGIFIYFAVNQLKYIEKQKNKHPQLKTKEDYFEWKENRLKESADLETLLPAPDKEEIVKEEPAWTRDSIYEALGKIDWYQFEKFSETLLSNEGYAVERKGGAQPDGGVDLVVMKDSDTILVQCKHWKTWGIKPKIVREMLGTMSINKTNKGVIYTLKGASIAASELAAQQGIGIDVGHGLADRALCQLSKEQLDSILKTDVHHCPKCEAEMVWREGNFKPFWGCPRYPRCRGKLEHNGAK